MKDKGQEDVAGWVSKAIITALCSIIATGLVAWFTMGGSTMTRQEIKGYVDTEIQRAPYPYLSDKNEIQNHIHNPAVHENDAAKRARIREEIRYAMDPVTLRLDLMNKSLADMREEVKTLLNGR